MARAACPLHGPTGIVRPRQKKGLLEPGTRRTAGCDEIQGFLFSKPLPADVFGKFIETGKEGEKVQRKRPEKVLVMPVGEVDQKTIAWIAGTVRETFQCETVQDEPIPVPQKAYNARRDQYNSTKILQALETRKPGTFELLLGIFGEDLYVPELNFVFGQADMIAKVAVIALPRLRQEFYGLEPDRELFLLRAAKEAIHEIGHMKGLGHCRDPRCVMHFSNSLEETDVKEATFCSYCRNTLTGLK
jgi:archaemetzincin